MLSSSLSLLLLLLVLVSSTELVGWRAEGEPPALAAGSTTGDPWRRPEAVFNGLHVTTAICSTPKGEDDFLNAAVEV